MVSDTDPVSGRVFAFNGRSKNSTVIDAKTGMVVRRFRSPGKPGAGGGRHRQGLREHRGHQVESSRSTPARPDGDEEILADRCDGPSGLAFDAKNRRLFPVCSNRVDGGVGSRRRESDWRRRRLAPVPTAPRSIRVPATPSARTATAPSLSLQQSGGKWEVLENIATERGRPHHRARRQDPQVVSAASKTRPTQGNARPTFLPDTFKVLVVGK